MAINARSWSVCAPKTLNCGPPMSFCTKSQGFRSARPRRRPRRAWLDRYGADYATEAERRAGYREFKAKLAEMSEVFGGVEDDRGGS